MRISSNTIFSQGVQNLNSRQRDLANLQTQISTGKRIQSPSDDPVGAARALELRQTKTLNLQLTNTNVEAAKASLSISETSVSSMVNLMQDVRQQAVYAGNPSLGPQNREAIAIDIDSQLKGLLSLANATDGAGRYLFSGYQSSTQPFVEVAPGTVAYFGDQGQRSVQIGPSSQIPVSDSGFDLLGKVRDGNGTFYTAPYPANTGSGVIDPGSVVNQGALTGHDYSVVFAVAGSTTTYSVIDNTTAVAVVPPGTSYTPGSAITFDGMQFKIDGSPANGDQFTARPSNYRGVFETISDLAKTLRRPAENTADRTRYQNDLNQIIKSIDNAMDGLLSAQGAIGTRLNKAESTQSTGEELNIQYQTSLSQIEDLDYNQAISDLTLQSTYLEAAQKSFVKLQGLSLFNFMS